LEYLYRHIYIIKASRVIKLISDLEGILRKKIFLIRVIWLLLAILIFGVAGSVSSYDCGDLDQNDIVDIIDIIYFIDHKFKSGPPPPISNDADLDGSGVVDLLDIVYFIDFKFKGGPDPDCPEYDHADITGFCQSSPVMKSDSATKDAGGYMTVSVIGSDLYIYHWDAFYQCCLEYNVDYLISENVITAREYDTREPCDCFCHFDLESVLYDLPGGTYTVILIDEYGNIVGEEVVEIPGAPSLVGFDHSGCLDMAKGSVSYSYSNGILMMIHADAYMNCSADIEGISVEIEVLDNIIRFFEINNSSEVVYCMCYYEVSAEVANIMPGNYIAEVYILDAPNHEPQLVDVQEIIIN
jgi:hypothetical protein